MPDLCLPVPHGGFHGLYVEMKRLRGNTTTKDQDDWLDFLKEQGYFTAVCKGWEAAAKVILEYIKMPLTEAGTEQEEHHAENDTGNHV